MIFDSKPYESPGERIVKRLFGPRIESAVSNHLQTFRRDLEVEKRAIIDDARSRSAAIIAQAEVESDAIRKQATNIDKDDHLWNNLTSTRRDLNPIDQYRLIEVANFLATRNPLAKRIREIRRDFVIGEGLKVEAEDEEIQKIIDACWTDPVNNMDEFQIEIVDFLGINGEVFIPTFRNIFTGAVQFGWIDPAEVEKVIADRKNRRVMREVVMKLGTGAGAHEFITHGQQQTYQIIHVDRSAVGSPTWNYRVGNIFHHKINCAPDARRGRSDFEAFADLVDAWDQAVFNDLERAIQLLNFIWDVEFQGLDDEEIEKKLQKMSQPRPGSMRGHNEKVKWDAVTPDLKAADFRTLSEGIRDDVLGAAGLAPTFFGITSNSNLASAAAIDVPILKGLTARQRKVKAIFREMVDYIIDSSALANKRLKMQLELKKISRNFDITMPEISIKDLSKIGSILTQMATGLEVAVQRGWLSNETASKTFAAFLMQFDIKANYEEEQILIGKENKEREKRDITDEKQKTLSDKLREMESDEEEEEEQSAA